MELRFNPDKKYRISCADIAGFCQVTKYTPFASFLKESAIQSRLGSLLIPSSGIINGDEVKKQIFPTDRHGFNEFDIFISHSHNDIHEAEALAHYLRSMGYNPFLDNYVWGSADTLQKEIDKLYSLTEDSKENPKGRKYYEYKKVQFSSSHIHTMLSMAILEMIGHCESFIFIESDRSIDYNTLRDSGHRTESPWIFQELQYASILSAMHPSGIREGMYSDTPLRINYEVNLKNFRPLDASNISTYFSRRRLLS